MLKTNAYKLPSSWEARELLREKGQFWTPDWIAEPMVEYVLAEKDGLVFDPAVGTGAFFRAAKAIASEKGISVRFAGMEIDPTTLSQARDHGLSEDDIASVEVADFVLQPPRKKFHAIVANPPYIRHHRLTPEKMDDWRSSCLLTRAKVNSLMTCGLGLRQISLWMLS